MNDWDMPLTTAEIDDNVPIARSERPRPPSFMGVERYSTSVSEKNVSRREIDDRLNAATMIPGTSMAHNDNGLWSFSFPSSIVPSSFCVFFLNRLESGNGSFDVSLRKMVPTSQAMSNITEQTAQGKK